MYQLSCTDGSYNLRFLDHDPDKRREVLRIFEQEMSRTFSPLQPTIDNIGETKIVFHIDNEVLVRYLCNVFGNRHRVTVEMR